jgi:hypothetical protein
MIFFLCQHGRYLGSWHLASSPKGKHKKKSYDIEENENKNSGNSQRERDIHKTK